jgi:hypothetical protein
MKKLSIALGAALLLVASACSSIFIVDVSKPDPNLQLKPSNVIVIADNAVSLIEFIKTFNKKYPTGKEAFVNEYVQAVSRKIKANGATATIKVDKSPHWDLLKTASFSTESAKTIDSLITNTQADYLLRIYNFSIDNRIQHAMMAGGPGMPMMNSSSEFCVVKAKFQFINTKTKQIALEFTSVGEGAVSFFAFENALNEAMLQSMDHAAEYLKSGTVEFKKAGSF